MLQLRRILADYAQHEEYIETIDDTDVMETNRTHESKGIMQELDDVNMLNNLHSNFSIISEIPPDNEERNRMFQEEDFIGLDE